MFSRFAVTVTDVDPGAVPHIEAVIGGAPQELGMPSNIGGISPFTASCGVIESSIVFVFTDVLPDSSQRVCEVAAQEIAHSYGLDHEMLASDPMTYLSYTGARTFQDRLAPCGESAARPCGIAGFTCRDAQNSVALLRERLGARDLVAPQISISAPAEGDLVTPAFTVSVTASDDVAVASAALYVDGEQTGQLAGPGPYEFPTDRDLAPGPHTIDVEASDGRNTARATIHVDVIEGGGERSTGLPGISCSAGGAPGGAAGAAGAIGLALLRRRRRRARA
jgi:MYXO-CTERM domain-containing protein